MTPEEVQQIFETISCLEERITQLEIRIAVGSANTQDLVSRIMPALNTIISVVQLASDREG